MKGKQLLQIIHMFWKCHKIQPYWGRVNAVLNVVLGYVAICMFYIWVM